MSVTLVYDLLLPSPTMCHSRVNSIAGRCCSSSWIILNFTSFRSRCDLMSLYQSSDTATPVAGDEQRQVPLAGDWQLESIHGYQGSAQRQEIAAGDHPPGADIVCCLNVHFILLKKGGSKWIVIRSFVFADQVLVTLVSHVLSCPCNK